MPPKKKLSKKEKARLEAEQAELMRIEMEKEKLKKLEEARQRRKIEREQAKHRLHLEIQENKQRRGQLKNSMEFFNQVHDSIDIIKNSVKSEIEWEKFMRCNGLPNSNSPGDIRKYIHQWKMDVAQRNQESRNWLLKTNERTLLTQDYTAADLTKATLKKQQGSLGDVYAQRFKVVLGILTELDETLMDKTKPSHTLDDLVKLKTEIRIMLKEYLDDFTYRTMSHIERDMEIDRPGVSKHIYDSEVFKSFIWTFSKDAQIALSTKPRIGDQNAHNEIDFPLMDMQLSLPPSVILYSSALRGLWLSYDHLSDYCGSFNLKRPRSANINILTQTKKEWRKRKEILQNMLDDCSREVPLAELEKIEQEQNSGSKSAREKTLDVDKLYLEYEEELNKLRRKAIGPEGLGLIETDINLRKYRIIGGVYCMDFLETPMQDKQLNARSFIRTIMAPNKLAHKTYYQTYKPPPPPLPGVRRLPEEIEAEMRMVEAALDKLAMVTVQLPDSVIWFEPPIACRWETHMETFESELTEGTKPTLSTDSNSGNNTEATPLSTTTNASPLKSLSPRFPLSKLRKKSSQKSSGSSNLPVREINDFDMYNIPNDVDIYGLVTDFVVPRLPPGFSVRFDTQRLRKMLHKWSKGHKPGIGDEKKPTVLYIARPKNVTFTPLPVSVPEGEDENSQMIVVVIQETTEDTDEGKAATVGGSKLFEQKRLTEDFLDLNEPREFFPCVQFKKVLKIKTVVDYSDKVIVDTLDLKKRRVSVTTASKVGSEKNETVSRNDSKTSLESVKSSKSSQSKKSSCKASRQSSQQSVEENIEEKKAPYMFSQLIEDLDHLCELQMPKEPEEEPNQMIAGNGEDNNSQHRGSAAGGSAGEKSPGAESGGCSGDIGGTPTNSAAASAAAAALAYYSGISFVRDSEATKNQADEEEEDDDLMDSSSEDEYDDDEDDEEYYLNELTTPSNINNDSSGNLLHDPTTMTTDDNLTYRSDASGTSAGAGDREALLQKQGNGNVSDGKNSKLSSATTTFLEGKWSARDVHDTKFNEDKFSIQFRTGRLGIFGFALNRYSNMPYQTWEIRPDMKNPDTILFSFTASLVSLDITITSHGFCVNNFQGGSTVAINEMIGKTLSLEAIKHILISSAVDIFPDDDAFCYTEGSCEKNYVMEMHLYGCMASLGLSHNFSWSRWNLLAGTRTAVLLIREFIEGKKVPNHSTLLVTPLKTAIIDCTEVSASFNSLGIAGMDYYADLYQLAQVHAQPCSLEKQKTMDPVLRDNAATILMAIRPLSFC